MEWSFLIVCIVTLALFPGLSSACSANYVRCGEGGDCIRARYICDGTQHCPDGRDEDPQLCSFWSHESCGHDNIRCNNNCYSMWDGCNSRCPSDIRSGEMCKVVLSKKLPEPYSGLELASKSRQRRATSWFIGQQTVYADDEDLIEGSAEGSGNDVNNQDVETVDMLSKAVTSKISELECPMLYTKVGNYCVSFFSIAQVPWPEARQFCQSIYGDLLTIENIQLYTGLLDYLREKGLSSDFWLGGRYDMDLNNWCWLDDTPMPSNSPYWALRYSSTCKSRNPGGKCFNYVQLPEQHTQGYCAAITYETYFYISDEKCSLRKSPLCLIDMKKLQQVKMF